MPALCMNNFCTDPKSVCVNPDTFSRSVALLAAGVMRTEEIIDQVISLKDIARVFEEKLHAGGGKVLIDCGGEDFHEPH